MKGIKSDQGREWAPALLLAALALAIRAAALTVFRDSVLYAPVPGSGHDRAVYLSAIRLALSGTWLPDGALSYLPLYPWVMGLVARFASDPLAAAAWFGILCDTATTLLIVRLARRLGAEPLLAGAAGLLYACYPLAIVYSLLTMPNTLNALGLTLFAHVATGLLDRPSRDPARPPAPEAVVGLGLFGGVLALGFAGMLAIGAGVAALLAWRARSALMPLLFLAGLAVPLVLPALHNSRAEGSFVLLTTHGGFNFYMGNHERATGYPLRVEQFRMTAQHMLEDAHRHAEQQSGRKLTQAESGAWWRAEAHRFWRDQPVRAVRLTVKKAMLFWNRIEMDDLRMREQLRITDPAFRWLPPVQVSLFLLFGLAGLVFTRGATAARTILLVGMVSLVLFFITARYRLTLTPLMAALGAAGFSTLLADWDKRRRWPVLLLVPMLALVNWPFPVRDQRPVDHYNASIQLVAGQKVDEAMRAVEAGLAIDPRFGPLHFARGNLLFNRERYAEAAESFRAAIQYNPLNPIAHFNLALALARDNDACGARDVLRRAAQTGVAFDLKMDRLLRELNDACTTASP